MASGGVAEKKAKKGELEEELKKLETAPINLEKEKADIKAEITRVAAEKVVEEKKVEAEEGKKTVPSKSASEVNVEKPEKGLELEEKTVEMKAREYRTPEEVKGEEERLGAKAAELRERDFQERVRMEEAEKEKRFGETEKARRSEAKKEQAQKEKTRIKRPPTAAEMEAEEAKRRKLEGIQRRERIKKQLEERKAKEELAKRKIVGKNYMQIVRSIIRSQKVKLDEITKKLREKFKLLWK